MKVYLCGAINGCTDEECTSWREEAKSILSDTLDPMRRDYRGKEEDCYREIVEGDKIDIYNSDILLVNYERPSVGTSMEILYAWERGKPIVLVTSKNTKISPWLRYHVTKIFNSFKEACKYIAEYQAEIQPLSEADCSSSFRFALEQIANDYVPDNDGQASQALAEMREALQGLLANGIK